MNHPVQVIEPTLDGYSGHCYSLVSSLCRAVNVPVDVWAAKGAEQLEFRQGVRVHAHFQRRVRLFQQLFLYRRLLTKSDAMVVTTARRSDLIMLNLVARGELPPNRIFLYFHWFRETPKRLQFLQRMAARQPGLVIFGTTESVVGAFQRAGFPNVQLLAYPSPLKEGNSKSREFRGLLYAGAARRDKGFRQVVDLVELLAQRREAIPVTVQISADHFGKYDSGTVADIARLRRIGYAHLHLVEHTLSTAEYAALFPGRICLQPYDRAEFTDRVSGVTLDALAHGCPVVTTAGTWMAALIAPQTAGIALETPSAATLYEAARAVISDYPRYSAAALESGRARDRASWTPLLTLLGQSQ